MKKRRSSGRPSERVMLTSAVNMQSNIKKKQSFLFHIQSCLILDEWIHRGQNYNHCSCKRWHCPGRLHRSNCALLHSQQKDWWAFLLFFSHYFSKFFHSWPSLTCDRARSCPSVGRHHHHWPVWDGQRGSQHAGPWPGPSEDPQSQCRGKEAPLYPQNGKFAALMSSVVMERG